MRHVLVDEPRVFGQRADNFEAPIVAGIGMNEIAVEQAIVINARGRKRVANKKHRLRLGPVHQQRAVVKHLAREKTKRKLVLVPSQFRAILHRHHARHRVFGEAGHQITAGVFHHVGVLGGGVHGAFEKLGRRFHHL